jgi:PIN domain nuclease of toxin-antitoxin system
MQVTDGKLLDWRGHGVPAGVEAFLHEGGVVYLWDGFVHAGIDTTNMTLDEVRRAVALALENMADPVARAVNRKARRRAMALANRESSGSMMQ